MGKPARMAAVINRSSGGGAGADAAADALRNTARDRGIDLDVHLVEGKQVPDALAKAAEAGVSRVVLVGGDGTVNGGAACALEHGLAIGIVAMGTLNYVARDLSLPRDAAGAAAVALGSDTRRIDVGEVNGRLFVHTSVVGVVPEVGRWRERARGIRKQASAGRVAAHLWRGARVAWAGGRRTLRFREDGAGDARVERRMLAMVAVGPLEPAPPIALTRSTLNEGRLYLYEAAHRGTLGTLKLVTGLMVGRWSQDDLIHARPVETLEIDARHRALRVSNDGEILKLDTPLRYRVRRAALEVAAPPETVQQD